MRAAVTGGAGFIGSHVVDALVARGDEVHVLDNFATGRRENLNDAATVHEHDIREPLEPLFDEIAPELVVHLAAQADVGTSVERPLFDAEVNVVGTVNVLEAARAARRAARLQLHRRRDLRRVRAPGAGGRRAPAALALRHRQARGRGVPRDLEPPLRDAPRRAPVRERLRAAAAGEARGRRRRDLHSAGCRSGESVTIFGDGEQTRDYVYVGDVVAAVLAAVGHDGGVFNVGTGERDVRQRALRGVPARGRRRGRGGARACPRRARCCAASSTSRSPSASSAGGRRRRSRRVCS